MFLVDDSSDNKKTMTAKKNSDATKCHTEDKDVLLNQKCLRHSINRIPSKNYRTGTYEINKISLLFFDDKI